MMRLCSQSTVSRLESGLWGVAPGLERVWESAFELGSEIEAATEEVD
jgi:hypothetical protein